MNRALERFQPGLALLAAGGTLAVLLVIYQLARNGQLELALPLLIASVGALVLLRFPWAGFALLVASVPVQRLGAEGGPLPVTLTQLAFPVAIAGLVIGLAAGQPRLRGHALLIPYCALVLVMLASAVRAQSGSAALAEIARWAVALAAFWLALQFVVGSSRRMIAFVTLLALGGVFEATIGVLQSVLGAGPFQLQSGVSRAFGTFGKPNSYAGYLEMTLFPAVWLGVWYVAEYWRRLEIYRVARLQGMAASREQRLALARSVLMALLLLGSAAIILGGIVASLSRGAWLGVAVGALVTALLFGRTTRLVTITAIAAAGAIFLSGQTWLIPEDFRDRISASVDQVRPFNPANVVITDENFAAAERFAHWQAGLGMFQDYPLLGIGAGNFNTHYEDYSVRETFRHSQGHAHNFYIHTLAETGMLGLLAYLTLLGSVMALALRVLLSRYGRGSVARAVVLGAFGSIVAVAAHNVFEHLHVLNMGIVISLLWALVIAGHVGWRHDRLEETQRAA